MEPTLQRLLKLSLEDDERAKHFLYRELKKLGYGNPPDVPSSIDLLIKIELPNLGMYEFAEYDKYLIYPSNYTENGLIRRAKKDFLIIRLKEKYKKPLPITAVIEKIDLNPIVLRNGTRTWESSDFLVDLRTDEEGNVEISLKRKTGDYFLDWVKGELYISVKDG
jgi:hypothetical protein